MFRTEFMETNFHGFPAKNLELQLPILKEKAECILLYDNRGMLPLLQITLLNIVKTSIFQQGGGGECL